MNIVQNFLEDESAAITVEFVLMGGVVAAVSIAALINIAGGVSFRSHTDGALIADTDRNATAIDLMHDGVAEEVAGN